MLPLATAYGELARFYRRSTGMWLYRRSTGMWLRPSAGRRPI